MDSEIYDADSLYNTRTIQCYIIKRAIEFTASGFLPKLLGHICNGDVTDWLEDEMQHVPLELT